MVEEAFKGLPLDCSQ